MKAMLPAIIGALGSGESMVLVTILQVDGSTPRDAGAAMLVFPDGRCLGTVGGGLAEHQAQEAAKALLQSGKALLDERYSLGAGSGMVCGGQARMLFDRLTERDLPVFRALQKRMDGEENLWLTMAIQDGCVQLGWMSDTEVFSLPEGADAAMLRGVKPILQGSVFSLPIERAGHAYVLGGGHVAQALVPLLSKLDFSPVVYDDREEFASKALFPDAEKVICASFEGFSSLLCVRACDRLVIMTRGHAYDHAVLVQALRTPACYIGLIGSKNKIAHTKALLLEQGFTQSDFARVHTPIGLPIKAQTPMEIAVSVAAEMILDRATQEA